MARWLGFGWIVLVVTAVGCAEEVVDEDPVPCGPVSCDENQYCCDAACGICQDQGVACTDMCPE